VSSIFLRQQAVVDAPKGELERQAMADAMRVLRSIQVEKPIIPIGELARPRRDPTVLTLAASNSCRPQLKYKRQPNYSPRILAAQS